MRVVRKSDATTGVKFFFTFGRRRRFDRGAASARSVDLSPRFYGILLFIIPVGNESLRRYIKRVPMYNI